jgi:hypothetical protein
LPLCSFSSWPVDVHFQKSEWLVEHGAPAMALLAPFSVMQEFPRSALLSWNQAGAAAAPTAGWALPGLAAAVAGPTVSASPVPSSAATAVAAAMIRVCDVRIRYLRDFVGGASPAPAPARGIRAGHAEDNRLETVCGPSRFPPRRSYLAAGNPSGLTMQRAGGTLVG